MLASGAWSAGKAGLLLIPLLAGTAAWRATSEPPRPNPAVTPAHTLEHTLQPPAPVQHLLTKSCADCHSDQTRWPWYARLAPLTALIERDIVRGRRAMNFSTWSAHAGRRPEIAASVLSAACADVQQGRMPPATYLLAHPGARLSTASQQQFCEWTRTTVDGLLRAKRQQLAANSVKEKK